MRPFQTEESYLFFGRETHTAELLRRLSQNRFLSVVGNSGSGKSSLVRAGLLPALYRGRLVGATSRWRIAVMRPGSAPLDALAEALAAQQVFSADPAPLRAELARSSLGLVRAVRASGLADGESLLLVVDQFEELIRFARERNQQDGGAEATLFVASLLEAAAAFTAPVYVVLTIRSDYIGDCTQFAGLPEELNRSQYLIPRLTREQLREAIESPLRLVGASMHPRLVERLLNDAGDDPGLLPVLQHALNRTYQKWIEAGAKGEIEIGHYADAGTLSGALDAHADALWSNLPAQVWAEKVFRCLTADSLLVHSGKVLNVDSVIDIPHESLIANWSRLDKWVEEEREAAAWYTSAAEDAMRFRKERADTWRNPKLAIALGYLESGHWNEEWAGRLPECGSEFAGVKEFLAKCSEAYHREHAEQEARREKELNDARALADAERKAKRLLLALAAALLIALAGATILWQRQVETERLQVDAERRLRMLSESLGENEQRTRIMKDGMKYVWIPPGKFTMGCSANDEQCASDEKPAHPVEITKGFWIGQTEVTQAAWLKVMGGDNPSFFKGEQLPVERITWDQARDYCAKIGGRLPTEAEWEYAARAGSAAPRHMDLDAIAWYSANSGTSTHPVAKKLPNRFGLYDSLGNVWEWTADWYDPKSYEQKVAVDPQGPSNGQERILRGGSWGSDPEYVRVSNRNGYEPPVRYSYICVRCAGEFR